MEDWIRSINRTKDALSRLSSDVLKMAAEEEQEAGKKDKKKASLKSLQPLTRLRNSKQDIINAKSNPTETFIEDKLNDIFEDY